VGDSSVVKSAVGLEAAAGELYCYMAKSTEVV